MKDWIKRVKTDGVNREVNRLKAWYANKKKEQATANFRVQIAEQPKSRVNKRKIAFLVTPLFVIGALLLAWGMSPRPSEEPKSVIPAVMIAGSDETEDQESPRLGLGSSVGNSKAGNLPPKVISAEIQPAHVYLGDSLEVMVSTSDPNDDSVASLYTWEVNGEVVLAGEESTFSTEGLMKHDRVIVRVTPYDGEYEGVEYTARSVMISNRPPQITSSPAASVKDGIYSYQVVAEDLDGDPLEFELKQAPDGMTIDQDTGLMTWSVPEELESVRVRVAVTDGDGGEAFQEFTLFLTPKS